MLTAHYALAAIVKARQPQLPLWSLLLASMLPDIVFVLLYFAGIERMTPVQGTQGYYGDMVSVNIEWSHSLVSVLVMSLVAGLAAMVAWGRRNGAVIGVMVLSHWLLDFIARRSDMPLLPGGGDGGVRFGLGLWQIPWLVLVIELTLAVLGAFMYYHAAMQRAVLAERQESRDRGERPGYTDTQAPPAQGYRQSAVAAAAALFVLLAATLIADLLICFPL
jgi:membrane-bound metal-dependent hydrolase YbcI (DUF457 family)